MEDKEKSEIEIINDNIEKAVDMFDNDVKRKNKTILALKKNQNNFYHWQQIEKGVVSYMNTDEQLFHYIKNHFGEGMLRAVIKRYIPSLKKDLREIIDEQIEDIGNEKAEV